MHGDAYWCVQKREGRGEDHGKGEEMAESKRERHRRERRVVTKEKGERKVWGVGERREERGG